MVPSHQERSRVGSRGGGPLRVARRGVLSYAQAWDGWAMAPEIPGDAVTRDPTPASTRGLHGPGAGELMKEGTLLRRTQYQQ